MAKDELTPEQMFAAEEPEVIVARGLNEGRPVEEIVESLTKLDWTPEAARDLVLQIDAELRAYHTSPAWRQRLRMRARVLLMCGIVVFASGLALSILSILTLGTRSFLYHLSFLGILIAGLLVGSIAMARLRLYRSEDLKSPTTAHSGGFPVQEVDRATRNPPK